MIDHIFVTYKLELTERWKHNLTHNRYKQTFC